MQNSVIIIEFELVDLADMKLLKKIMDIKQVPYLSPMYKYVHFCAACCHSRTQYILLYICSIYYKLS